MGAINKQSTGFDFLFLTSVVALLLYLLSAVFAPLLSLDSSEDANRQLPEAAKLSPFTEIWILKFSKKENTPVIRIRAPDLIQTRGFVFFKNIKGQMDSLKLHNGLDDIPFSEKMTFFLGTDVLGRDVLSRLLLGGRISLSVGIAAVCFSVLLGGIIGIISGYYGGLIDRILQGFTSLIWSIPSVLLALSLSFVIGRGFLPLFISIGLSIWVELARIIRARTLQLKSMDFVIAAQATGIKSFNILLYYILPNLWGSILIVACSNFATAILLEAGLSFLGMGINPPTPSWGTMIFEGYSYIALENGKWLAIYPGLALVILIFCVNLATMGLKEFFERKNMFRV